MVVVDIFEWSHYLERLDHLRELQFSGYLSSNAKKKMRNGLEFDPWTTYSPHQVLEFQRGKNKRIGELEAELRRLKQTFPVINLKMQTPSNYKGSPKPSGSPRSPRSPGSPNGMLSPGSPNGRLSFFPDSPASPQSSGSQRSGSPRPPRGPKPNGRLYPQSKSRSDKAVRRRGWTAAGCATYGRGDL